MHRCTYRCCYLVAVGTLLTNLALTRAADTPIQLPQLADNRLTVELFAADPDIVTPFGIAVDQRGRVLVVESHTHMRPDDYSGPPNDRLRMLEDVDGDGRADRATTFYEGGQWLMNVAVHPNGWIYAITRNELFRVRDRDDDGRADEHETLARMETSGDYPHNGFLSLTIDFTGDVYMGMGQNYGASYVLTGRDGQAVSSLRGDGGIFRCSAEGEGLTRIALGFWNPCGLGFDAFGRLFTVDNDPGNRPPCRFIEVVAGGDFGYRRHALEPFISWNGELPATLPMITSTAEAPTAVVAYEATNFPAEYRGGLLVSSWSEYRIDRYILTPQGASFTAATQPLVTGDDEFRPAGLVVAPDGSLLVSDWVDRSYPVHGRGRVWRIRVRTDGPPLLRTAEPPALDSPDRALREAAARRLALDGPTGIRALRAAFSPSAPLRVQSTSLAALIDAEQVDPSLAQAALGHPASEIREQALRLLPPEFVDPAEILRSDRDGRVRAAALRRVKDARHLPLAIDTLDHQDPFLRQAAGLALAQSAEVARLMELTRDADPVLRHAAIVALRASHPERIAEILPAALSDPSEQIRFTAVEWIAEHEQGEFRQALVDQLPTAASFNFFEALLAAVAQIDGVMQDWTPGRVGDWWKPRSQSYALAAELLVATHASAATRRLALRFLPPRHAALRPERLAEMLSSPDSDLELQLGVLRALGTDGTSVELRERIARDAQRPADVRAEAVMGLDPNDFAQRSLLVELAGDEDLVVRAEALRTLRGVALEPNQLSGLETLASRNVQLAQLVALLVQPDATIQRPPITETDRWLERLEGPGDPAVGARIFFHPRGPGCASCHQIDGRGIPQIGPTIQRTRGVSAFSRRQLVESILQPSKEIALGYVPLQLVTRDGRVHVGIPRSEAEGRYELIDSSGKQITVDRSEVEQIATHSQSIMPDGLAQRLTDSELRDLIAYLLEH